MLQSLVGYNNTVTARLGWTSFSRHTYAIFSLCTLTVCASGRGSNIIKNVLWGVGNCRAIQPAMGLPLPQNQLRAYKSFSADRNFF